MESFSTPCLMCGASLTIAPGMIGHICQCDECGELMMATKNGMRLAHDVEHITADRPGPFYEILSYPPMAAVVFCIGSLFMGITMLLVMSFFV